jgi:hypothetical protein
MSALHVLMPPLAHVDEHPAFHHWLARGERLPDVQGRRVAALRGLFHFAGEGIPAAALRHYCHAGDAGDAIWLCADPAYVRSEATGARLMACPANDISDAEAEAIAATLSPFLSEMGVLRVDTPSEWCVQLASGTQPATFADAEDALGASLIDVLPGGSPGRMWRRLFNEIQVALHAHPVNTARVAARKLPVNALWFWGAGALPDAVDTSLAMVASTDDVVRGLAKLAGAVRVEPLPDALETVDAHGDALLDLQPLGGRESAAEWLPVFERWLRRRRFDAIALTFAGGERYRMRHAHRLRFWRRG